MEHQKNYASMVLIKIRTPNTLNYTWKIKKISL